MSNLFEKCRIRTWSRAELSYDYYDYFIINLFANCRIRTWNRTELSYECFIINSFANCRIRTWSRAELSYEYLIINLLINCRSRTWSRAGPSTCFNAECALSHKTMEIHVSSRSKNTIPVFFQLRSKRAKN